MNNNTISGRRHHCLINQRQRYRSIYNQIWVQPVLKLTTIAERSSPHSYLYLSNFEIIFKHILRFFYFECLLGCEPTCISLVQKDISQQIHLVTYRQLVITVDQFTQFLPGILHDRISIKHRARSCKIRVPTQVLKVLKMS